MLTMRRGPLANAVIRTALAVLFGFMSLVHGPVMAFAQDNVAPAHHATQTDAAAAAGHRQHAGHHQSSGHDQHAGHAVPDAAPSCYGVGCFIVLGSFAPPSPAASVKPIATLLPSTVEAMVATNLDPVVPPPRIQV